MAANIVFNPVMCGLLVLLRTVESASDPLPKQQCSWFFRIEIETVETYCFYKCYTHPLAGAAALGSVARSGQVPFTGLLPRRWIQLRDLSARRRPYVHFRRNS